MRGVRSPRGRAGMSRSRTEFNAMAQRRNGAEKWVDSGNSDDYSQVRHPKSGTNSSQRIPSPFMGEG